MEEEQKIDCVAFGESPIFTLSCVEGKEQMVNAVVGLCSHPLVVRRGDEAAFCRVFYGEVPCADQTPSGSDGAEILMQRIAEQQEAYENRPFEEVF